MSAKMQRVRKKSDGKSTPSNIQKKPIGSAKKHISYISTVGDFDSETLSSTSPIKPSAKPDKKVYRKKIRTTQDLNQLNSSTSQDSDASVKSEPRRAKKTKGMYALPKITCVQEDPFGSKENKPPDVNLNTNSLRKKSRKQIKKPDCEEKVEGFEQPTKRIKRLEDESTGPRNLTLDEDIAKGAVKNSLNGKQNSQEKSSKEYQTANYVLDVGKRDSEIEVNMKRKKKVQKRHENSESKTDTGGYYIRRIKKMLSNDSEVSNEEGPNSDSAPYIKNSARKNKLLVRSTQQNSNIRRSQSLGNDSIKLVNLKDNENSSSEKSVCTSKRDEIHDLKRSEKKEKLSFLANNELNGQRRSVSSMQIAKDKINRNSVRRTKSLFINSVVTIKDFEEINDNTDSNDVFDTNESTASPLKVRQQTSGSVTFLSPEENVNVKHNSLDVNENTNHVYPPKSVEKKSLHLQELLENKCYIFQQSCHTNSSSESTSEIDTHTIEKSVSGTNTLENKLVPDNVVNKSSILNETYEINSPRQVVISSKRKRKRSTVGLPSPIYGTSSTKSVNELSPFNPGSLLNKTEILPPENQSLKYKKDTFAKSENGSLSEIYTMIDLTSPVVKKFHNSSGVILVETLPSENDTQDSVPEKLNRESTFTKVDQFQDEQRSLVNSNISSNYENVQTPLRAKLNRTATFTKDDDDNAHGITLQYDSPLVVNISNSKNIVDTSKVTKRRQWNKSPSKISFLDSLVDIANISAPWGEELNATLEKSEESLLESGEATKTLHYAINTPFPGPENDLLKQAPKEKRSVTFSESKDVNKVITKPGTKLTRKKMPNFALIHQRAYDKLESLKEMSERKAARAKLLLSGCKPDNISSKSKKCLQFTPTKSKPCSSNSGKAKKEETNRPNISITKVKNLSPSTSNPRVANKENKLSPMEKRRQLLKAKSFIPKLKVPNKVETEKKGFTRYGFKIGTKDVKAATKEEQMKAVATKSNIIKNTVEERRNAVKGVRSNRRFELLMALRNK